MKQIACNIGSAVLGFMLALVIGATISKSRINALTEANAKTQTQFLQMSQLCKEAIDEGRYWRGRAEAFEANHKAMENALSDAIKGR